jgi:cysteinyl-tRNA synthetase
MQVYNTLTKKMEELKPRNDKKIVMYVCGLTPYDNAHIGHARTYIAFDVIKRYLKAKGYNVFHIQNITDVDDKIINRCRETGADPKKLTERLHNEALELFDRLAILRADVYPRVSEHINEIILLIQTLIEKGYAYETPTGVYFDVAKFSGYGKLSGQRLDEIRAGARVEIDETKANPIDFALWKKTTGEILEWISPWGAGRPGWHIECSAMAMKFGGETIDIHGGARDLIFPHHENEIAQSEAATGKQFCRYWLHTGFLTVNGEKMSKSLGNFITISNALSKFAPNAIRMFFLQTHYRSPVDYDEEKIVAANEAAEYILNSYGLIKEELNNKNERTYSNPEIYKKMKEDVATFYKAMDNDFDTPNALASLFNLLRLVNSNAKEMKKEELESIKNDVEKILWILGLQEEKGEIESKREELKKLLDEIIKREGIKVALEGNETAERLLELIIKIREEIRKKKDFAFSDAIRTKLRELGIIIEDKENETRWKVL